MTQVAWHKPGFGGERIAYHMKKIDDRARKLLRAIEKSQGLTGKEAEHKRAELEMRYDRCVGQLIFLNNSLTASQKQLLATREFDEWMKALDDAKGQKEPDTRALAQPIAQ